MARKKEYNEEEVIVKAMKLFWLNGYESTSIRMLEKEMGINQFSIYSSFKNKHGIFIESFKCYVKQCQPLITKMKEGNKGIEDIEIFFHDFLLFCKENNVSKGCLGVNTICEMGNDIHQDIKQEILMFNHELQDIYMNKLTHNKTVNPEALIEKANYISISLSGLLVSSKILPYEQINMYIDTVIKNINRI